MLMYNVQAVKLNCMILLYLCVCVTCAQAAEQGHLETCVLLVSRYPILRTVKDKKSRLPVDLSPDHNTFLELLKPRQ